MSISKASLKNFVSNLPLTISAMVFVFIATCVLCCRAGYGVLLAFLLAIFSFFLSSANEQLRKDSTVLRVLVSAIISAILVYFFNNQIDSLGAISAIFSRLMTDTTLSIAIYVALTLIMIPACLVAINWSLEVEKEEKIAVESKKLNLFVNISGILVIALLVGMIFDINAIDDEFYSIRVAQKSFGALIESVQGDSHPPLYYLMLHVWLSIFPFAQNSNYLTIILSRIFSLIPCVLMIVVVVKKFKDSMPLSPIWMMLLLLGSMSLLIVAPTNIRMYSWAIFFVASTYLFVMDIINSYTPPKANYRSWIYLTFFAISSAYTHYFALISVFALYIILFISIIREDRNKLIPFFLSGIVIVTLYLPWLTFFLAQSSNLANDTWMKPVTLNQIVLTCGMLFTPITILLPFALLKAFKSSEKSILSFNQIAPMCVPLFLLIVMIISAFFTRNTLKAGYLIPSIMCFCLPVLAIYKNISQKHTVILVSILFFGIICNTVRNVGNLYKDISGTIQTHKLFERISDDAVFVFDGESTSVRHAGSIISSYIPNSVYLPISIYCSPDHKSVGDATRIQYYLDEPWEKVENSGKSIYFVTPGEHTFLDIPDYYEKTLLGSYLIGFNIYEIYKLQR